MDKPAPSSLIEEPESVKLGPQPFLCAAAVGILALAFLWSYWTTLVTMADRWAHDPQYSHGFLVPIFALVILWHRRHLLPATFGKPNPWGAALLTLGLTLRLIAVRMDLDPLDALSLLPSLLGLIAFVGGLELLRWSWPAVLFLGFMLPLPFRVEIALAHPLRRIATVMSTFVLQTIGYPAVSEGNVILIDRVRLGVEEACSGLGMLMTFFALATAMALVIKAPILDRLVLVASAVPIAILANVARVTATGIASVGWGREMGQLVHDQGWLMMPFALLVLWLELKYLSWLLVPPATDSAMLTSGRLA